MENGAEGGVGREVRCPRMSALKVITLLFRLLCSSFFLRYRKKKDLMLTEVRASRWAVR